MHKVNVLISTYNGEKYIREQIDSILNQTYENISIYVRDDGSTDNTLNILKEYENNGHIILLKETNIGFGRSFLKLLQYANDGNFWAFCDQDDVWDEHKIEYACECLCKMNPKSPNIYVHDFIFTDESLVPVSRYENYIKNYDFRMSITECLHMGFSMVINGVFRDLMLRGDISSIPSHDWWAELIAMEFGNIKIDHYIGAKHRRLNSSISENNIPNRIKWFIKALKGGSEIPYLTKEFKRVFDTEMKNMDLQLINLFVNEKYSLKNAINKSFYFKRWRTSITSEIVIRCLMLIGKI